MKYVHLIMLFLFSQSVIAQNELTSTIKGQVVDAESQFPLPGVNIVLADTTQLIGTTTDVNGNFRLENVPVGRQTIYATYIGFKTVTISNLLVISAKELEVNIKLEEDFTALDEIEIIAEQPKTEARNEMASGSTRLLTIDEAARYSGSLLDPARMAQNFAGVSGANDQRNDIIIRGNSPLGVLWRMEGIDIPSPNHFSTIGTTGGPISMLNINNLSNSDFSTSAWSAEYGNALSGVFDLKLRTGNNAAHEYMGQIGFNGFELGAEGPFKKGGRASYMANARYSTLEVFDALGIDLGVGNAIPEYKDMTFKVNMPTEKAGVFSVWGMGGNSFVEIEAEPETDSTNLFAAENEASRFTSATLVAGASHQYFFSDRVYGKLVVASTYTSSIGLVDSVGISGDKYHITEWERAVMKNAAHYKVNWKKDTRSTINGGIIGELYDIDFVDSVRYGVNYLEKSKFSGQLPLIQAYAQWKYKASEQLTLTNGLHSQHHFNSNSHVVEPRLGLRYQLNKKHSLNFGAGLHSQAQPLVVYFLKNRTDEDLLPNENLGFSKSLHLVLGHEWFVWENARIKSEIYFQQLYQIPVDTASSTFSMINEGADFVLPNRTGIENEGQGRNYGFELTFEKFLTKGFYALATISVFESQYAGSDGVWRNTAFNSNYVINTLAGKEFELNEKFTLSFDTKITYSGGKPVTPIDLEASQLYSTTIRDWTRPYSERYDPYFRWDFKVSFRQNGKKTAQEFAVDIQNITNHQNVFLELYKASTQSISTSYQRGFFPVVLYRLYF